MRDRTRECELVNFTMTQGVRKIPFPLLSELFEQFQRSCPFGEGIVWTDMIKVFGLAAMTLGEPVFCGFLLLVIAGCVER